MPDLAEWLLKQIAEDERQIDARIEHERAGLARDGVDVTREELVLDGRGDFYASPTFAHMLAECEAKRRIIARCEWELVRVGQRGFAEDTLRLLALPYADRPGYDESWRP